MSAGWSKAGSRRMGIRRPDYAPTEGCYYCGVPGCAECSAPLSPELVGDGIADVGGPGQMEWLNPLSDPTDQ